MASNPSERRTVANVAAQQGHLEGRVTGLERDMQNMSQAVSALTDTVKTGFAETREMMAVASRRQDERTSELHARLDRSAEKSAERGRWNPGLVIAAITCAVLMGAVFVSFVHMRTAPIETSVMRISNQTTDIVERERRYLEVIGQIEARLAVLEAFQVVRNQ